MTSAIQLIFFLRMLSVGIIAPVLALVLMAHGASIETISLLIGAYSVTVVAAEFPSGVLADLFGQKQAFLLSSLFGLLCYGLVLVSQSLLMLLFAMILNGLSRAFSSGTLDALAVNQTHAHDETALLNITSRFSILESAGLAIGALTGGVMAGIGNMYNVNIAVNIGISGLLFFLTMFGIHEKSIKSMGYERSPLSAMISEQVKQSIALIMQKGIVRTILVLSVATGFALIAVETYWQPVYTSYSPASWTLGIVSFGCFFSLMIGSKLIAHFLKKHTHHVSSAFLVLRAIFGAGLIGLYFASRAVPFVAVYMMSYFFLGGGSVAENTLIHRIAKDDQRSSTLSLFSFIMQMGGVLAAVIGFVVSANFHFKLMWPIAGALLILCSGCLLFVTRLRKNKQSV